MPERYASSIRAGQFAGYSREPRPKLDGLEKLSTNMRNFAFRACAIKCDNFICASIKGRIKVRYSILGGNLARGSEPAVHRGARNL